MRLNKAPYAIHYVNNRSNFLIMMHPANNRPTSLFVSLQVIQLHSSRLIHPLHAHEPYRRGLSTEASCIRSLRPLARKGPPSQCRKPSDIVERSENSHARPSLRRPRPPKVARRVREASPSDHISIRLRVSWRNFAGKIDSLLSERSRRGAMAQAVSFRPVETELVFKS